MKRFWRWLRNPVGWKVGIEVIHIPRVEPETVGEVGEKARAMGLETESSMIRKSAPMGTGVSFHEFLEKAPEEAICPQCRNSPDVTFCGRCGRGRDPFRAEAERRERPLLEAIKQKQGKYGPFFHSLLALAHSDPDIRARAYDLEAQKREAFRDLAEIAYEDRDAIWTSPRTLVRTALEKAKERPSKEPRSYDGSD